MGACTTDSRSNRCTISSYSLGPFWLAVRQANIREFRGIIVRRIEIVRVADRTICLRRYRACRSSSSVEDWKLLAYIDIIHIICAAPPTNPAAAACIAAGATVARDIRCAYSTRLGIAVLSIAAARAARRRIVQIYTSSITQGLSWIAATDTAIAHLSLCSAVVCFATCTTGIIILKAWNGAKVLVTIESIGGAIDGT